MLLVTNGQKFNSVINIDNGLVNNEVTAIVQDQKGFMWFGTRGGLHRYDGYEIKLLKNDLNVGNNLMSQSIEVLLNGADNNLWIGTKSGGLSMYDFSSGQLINYHNTKISAGEVNKDYILSLYEPNDRYLYIGTWQGFLLLDKKTRLFSVLKRKWKTYDIKPDGKGHLWVATGIGVQLYDPATNNSELINLGYPSVDITNVLVDSTADCLWLGTWRRGMLRYDLKTKTTSQYTSNPADKQMLGSENVYRIFKDSRGIMWIGTWGGGLYKFYPGTATFERVLLNITPYDNRDDKIIISISEDISGLLWIGTDGAGVCKLDPGRKKFRNIGYDPQLPQPIDNNHVLTVLTDRLNRLWIGTRGEAYRLATTGNNSLP